MISERPYRRPTRADRVPNEPLRARFEKLGASPSEVAREAGWTRSKQDPRPNAARVLRSLGLADNQGRTVQEIPYTSAVALARALDLDPIDAGV